MPADTAAPIRTYSTSPRQYIMPNSSPAQVRLFYALWPDDATRTALMELQFPMRGKKTPYSNLHITLAFLGPQPSERLSLLTDILEHLQAAPMTLTLDRVGYFPRKRIAWLGMHDAPQELLDMQRALVQALIREEVWFDGESNFKPHVTLARDASLPPDLVFTPITWRAKQIVLVQSITNPEGPTYRLFASRTLADDATLSDVRKVVD